MVEESTSQRFWRSVIDHMKPIDLKARMEADAQRDWDANHWSTHAFLDVDDRHPALFGDAILLRDDDGMGFALSLERWRGEHVKITIERVADDSKRLWPVQKTG